MKNKEIVQEIYKRLEMYEKQLNVFNREEMIVIAARIKALKDILRELGEE